MERMIKIGTRGSKLALWQANFVAEKLNSKGMKTSIITIETKGDKILNQPFAEIGSKGIFTEEIESKLLSGEVDIAVHSAKDLQSSLADELEILAFTEREKPNDVVVSLHPQFNLKDKSKNWVLGTSSARRRAILQTNYPHLEYVEARGNLQTRFRKLEEGKFDAMILAYAGIHRMGYDHTIKELLSTEEFIPAVGQGSIAIESFKGLEEGLRKSIFDTLDHSATHYCISAERSFLRTMEGGCSIPIFGLAILDDEILTLKGGVAAPDGTGIIIDIVSGHPFNAESIGVELANKIIEKGGKKIIEKFRKKVD